MCPVLYSGSTSRLVLNEANLLVALAGRCPALVLLFIQVPSRQSRKSRIRVDPLFSTWRTDLKTKSFSSIMASAVFFKAIFFFFSFFFYFILFAFLFISLFFRFPVVCIVMVWTQRLAKVSRRRRRIPRIMCFLYSHILFFFLPVYSLSVAVSVSIYLSVVICCLYKLCLGEKAPTFPNRLVPRSLNFRVWLAAPTVPALFPHNGIFVVTAGHPTTSTPAASTYPVSCSKGKGKRKRRRTVRL